MADQNFLSNRLSVDNYLAHPYAAREAVAEFANHPESSQNPEALRVLAQHHEEQAAAHDTKGRQQYQDPSLYGERAERAAFASFAQARGHREAANILRGAL